MDHSPPGQIAGWCNRTRMAKHDAANLADCRREPQLRAGWIDRSADPTPGPPHLSQIEDSAVRSGPSPLRSSSRPFPLAMKSALDWSIGVVKRCEIDPMPCSNGFDLLDPLLSDGPSSLREGFEPALQSERHAFE